LREWQGRNVVCDIVVDCKIAWGRGGSARTRANCEALSLFLETVALSLAGTEGFAIAMIAFSILRIETLSITLSICRLVVAIELAKSSPLRVQICLSPGSGCCVDLVAALGILGIPLGASSVGEVWVGCLLRLTLGQASLPPGL